MTLLHSSYILLLILSILPYVSGGQSWIAKGAEGTACYCDPIAPVSDCEPAMCSGFLISMFVMYLILLVPTVYIMSRQKWRGLRRGSRARPMLMLFLSLMSLSRVLHFGLLIGKVGETDQTGVVFVNLFLIVGGACLISAMSLIIYIWAKVYKSSVHKIPRFKKERRILLSVNFFVYFCFLLFNSLEITYKDSLFGLLFNAVVGVAVITMCAGFLVYGVKLFLSARSNQLVSRSNKDSLAKVTRLVGVIAIIGLIYVIILLILSLADTSTTTAGLVTRHVIYRVAEWIVGWALMLTFHQTKSKAVDAASRTVTAVYNSSLPPETDASTVSSTIMAPIPINATNSV